MPLNLGLDSEPEPDLAIVRRDPLNYVEGHPTSAVLLVEIAHSSLRHDRRKAKTYAAAGIEEYWISDVVRGVLEVYREPVDGNYRTRQVLHRGERIAPLVRPDVRSRWTTSCPRSSEIASPPLSPSCPVGALRDQSGLL